MASLRRITFFKKKLEDISPFCGATDTPVFWTPGDVSSGFQNQSRQPYLHLADAYLLHVH